MIVVGQVALLVALGSVSGAAIVDPTDIGGLVLWLDAGQGVTESGNIVSAWADQSGQGNNFSQSTAAYQPTFVASAFNTLPAISFATAAGTGGRTNDNDFLSNSSLQLNTTATAFFVMLPDSLPGDSTQRFGGHYGNGQFRFNSGKASMWTGGGNADLSTPLPTVGQFQTIAYRLNGNVQISIDGSAFTTTQTSASFSSSALLVGGVPNTFVADGASFGAYDGDFAEVIIYDAVLTDPQASDVFDYVAAKYVPEPSAGILSALGLLGLLACGRRRKT